jgi:hypothetical protein
VEGNFRVETTIEKKGKENLLIPFTHLPWYTSWQDLPKLILFGILRGGFQDFVQKEVSN